MSYDGRPMTIANSTNWERKEGKAPTIMLYDNDEGLNYNNEGLFLQRASFLMLLLITDLKLINCGVTKVTSGDLNFCNISSKGLVS
jgi:hypothetical protein